MYEIRFNAVFLMLYLWNNKDLSPTSYTVTTWKTIHFRR